MYFLIIIHKTIDLIFELFHFFLLCNVMDVTFNRPLTETSSTSSTRPILAHTQRDDHDDDNDEDEDEEEDEEGKRKCSLGRKICKVAKLLSGFLISMGLVMVVSRETVV